MDDPTLCPRCDAPLEAAPNSEKRCPRCGTPLVCHELPRGKFPFTIKIVSGTTGEVVWSRTVTIAEARTGAKIEVPGFAGSEHYPVRAEIKYADGTTEVGGMQ